MSVRDRHLMGTPRQIWTAICYPELAPTVSGPLRHQNGGIGSALVTDEFRRWRERDLPALNVYDVPALLVHCYR